MRNENEEHVGHLLRGHFTGTNSPEEEARLRAWVEESGEHRERFERWKRDDRFSREFRMFRGVDAEEAWECFCAKMGLRSKRRSIGWIKYAAAVVAMPLVIGAIWWGVAREEAERPVSVVQVEVPRLRHPAAVLRLADGSQVELSRGRKQDITVGGEIAARQDSSRLVYPSANAAENVDTNTLLVPPGGEFDLQLADGTRVYLNSASTLRYPVSFEGKERTVFLQGEAYFEVAKDGEHPFVVVTEDIRARVYGTEFNINTRGNDGVRTVLVEGSLGVQARGQWEEYLLRPNDMATYDRQSREVKVEQVDTRLYTLWRKGVFVFERETLENVMTTLAAWYDVEISFQTDEARDMRVSCYMKRYENVDEILHVLGEVAGVRFTLHGKTIIIAK